MMCTLWRARPGRRLASSRGPNAQTTYGAACAYRAGATRITGHEPSHAATDRKLPTVSYDTLRLSPVLPWHGFHGCSSALSLLQGAQVSGSLPSVGVETACSVLDQCPAPRLFWNERGRRRQVSTSFEGSRVVPSSAFCQNLIVLTQTRRATTRSRASTHNRPAVGDCQPRSTIGGHLSPNAKHAAVCGGRERRTRQ